MQQLQQSFPPEADHGHRLLPARQVSKESDSSPRSPRRSSRDNLEEEEDYAYVRHKAIPLDQLEKASGRGSLVPDSCFQWKEVAMVEDDEALLCLIRASSGRRSPWW